MLGTWTRLDDNVSCWTGRVVLLNFCKSRFGKEMLLQSLSLLDLDQRYQLQKFYLSWKGYWLYLSDFELILQHFQIRYVRIFNPSNLKQNIIISKHGVGTSVLPNVRFYRQIWSKLARFDPLWLFLFISGYFPDLAKLPAILRLLCRKFIISHKMIYFTNDPPTLFKKLANCSAKNYSFWLNIVKN